MSVSSVIAFLTATVVIDADARVASSDLYAAYLDWFPGIPEAGQRTTRRTFTAEIRDLMKPYSQVRYGPIRLDGRVTRGFKGLRLVEPDPADLPPGPLSTACTLLATSAYRRGGNAMFSKDMRVAVSLIIAAPSVRWARDTAVRLVDEYAEIYPELDTVLMLLDAPKNTY